MKNESNQNLSGNEVYHTNSLILLVQNMLCSKLHCQKGCNLIRFSYEILNKLSGLADGVRCDMAMLICEVLPIHIL